MKVQDPVVAPGPPTEPSGTRGTPDEELIIKEARKRQRHRYLLGTATLATLVAAIAIALAMTQGGGRPPRSGGRHGGTPTPRSMPPATTQGPPSVALPSSALFNQISVSSTGLLLTGTSRANGQSPESSPQSTCVSASLDAHSLAIGKLHVGSCGDPLLFGRTVEALNTQDPHSNTATVSINVADPTTGQVTSGPPVMTYASLSDTRPVLAYGNRWLWIYDVATTSGPELLQISADSGNVVNSLPMPALLRPLLAPGDGGVWVANSIGGSPAPALSYVSAGASAPKVVLSDTNVPVCWIEADGTSAWVGTGIQHACAKQNVERFVGSAGTPLFSVQGEFTPFDVIGGEADGLWTIQWIANSQQVVHIDPQTGAEKVVATLPSVSEPVVNQDEGLAPSQAVYFDGALYVLQPPFRLNGYLGYSSVVRVSSRLAS